MKILVLNCGSSSLKYQIIDMSTETLLCKGLVEKIGLEDSAIKHEKIGDEKIKKEFPMENHKVAISKVIEVIQGEHGVISDMSEIGAVGHRVGHAGEKYSESALVTDDVLKAIEDCIPLAPLHNPATLHGIVACQELMPDTPNVAVFDTAFHQSVPEENYIYAIPYEYYEKYGLRRYGFHGTSYRYVADICAKLMGKPLEELKIVACHLGNGASCAAIDHGKSVDTTMGFTPLEGLVMGTRCGSIDPAIVEFLASNENLDVTQVNDILYKESGLQGISGISSDFRDVEEAADNGNHRAKLAVKCFVHSVKTTIGGFVADMNGIDALIFTAGVGENDYEVREAICKDMEFFGIKIDLEKNNVKGKLTDLTAEGSKTKVFIIPTNEELMIARDTLALVTK